MFSYQFCERFRKLVSGNLVWHFCPQSGLRNDLQVSELFFLVEQRMPLPRLLKLIASSVVCET